jgi:hypothetical protein
MKQTVTLPFFCLFLAAGASVHAQNREVTDILPVNYDTLDFVPGHPFSAGVPVTSDDLGSAPSVLLQLTSFPLPRFRKGHGLNPNINWMNNEYLGRLNKVINAQNDLNIQEELCKKWNYMFSLNPNAAFPSAYQASLNSFANSHPQYKYSIGTNILSVATTITPDTLLQSQNCPTVTGFIAPNNNTKAYFDSLGKKMMSKIIQNVINNAGTALTNTIDYVSENGHEFPLFYLDPNGCPYNDPAQAPLNLFQNTFGADWNAYYGQSRRILEAAYRDRIIGQHALIPPTTKYSKYLVSSVYERTFFEDYTEMRSLNTPYNYNGQVNYYSTPPFYIPEVSGWKQPASGTNWGWIQVVQNPYNATGGGRVREITVYKDSLFAPFVSAGWTKEHTNVRPGQWLGLLKGLGVLGADFYHTGYFNETDNNGFFPSGTSSPVDPRGWGYQAVMPVYAQAITSRFEKFLHSGNIVHHTIMNTTFFVARKAAAANKFLLYGSVQQNSNLTGSAPATVTYQVSDATPGSLINGLKFELRRQGSTYIYDKDKAVFYQLDKWHERSHPSYWTKDIEIESELNDYTNNTTAAGENTLLNNTMSLKTLVPAGASPGDFTNYITVVEYASASAPLKSYYYFEPRDASSSAAKVYGLWVKARLSPAALGNEAKLDVALAAGGNVVSQRSVMCIRDTVFKWYYKSVVTGNTSNFINTTFTLSPNTEYELAFTGMAGVEFDKFLIAEGTGVPKGVPAAEMNPYTAACSVAGIAEHNISYDELTIYPNPFSESITIEGLRKDDDIVITGILGDDVYTCKSAGEEVSLSLSFLPPGIYFIKAGAKRNKIVKE